MGAKPHQGVGGGDAPHVRVVEGVRPVADLGLRLDPDDPVHEECVHGRDAIGADLVIRLDDRHDYSIPLSVMTLHEPQ